MILVCCASQGENLKLSQLLVEEIIQQGSEAELVDMVDLALPLYSPKVEQDGCGKGFEAVVARFINASAFVFVAPEYNGGTPPVLSNTLAWISRSGGSNWRAAFANKFAVIATHSGGGGMKVLAAMRSQLEHLDTTVLARQILTTPQKPLNQDSLKTVITQLLSLSRS